ncbi:29451_t:CDS:2 [Gigaspora margarita]|uniref:Fucosyltransferase n=1 Tax=Gigaspora margarita TaxID=4874 RepID=A0ABM8VZT4_GIGMA|nr:29451_t:CDS:2 [Gigaspora margarita]
MEIFKYNKKLNEGQKTVKLTKEPKNNCPGCHNGDELFDIFSSFDEDSFSTTSYVRVDLEILRTIQPFDITKLSPNSTLVSFVAIHMTEYKRTFIPSLEAHMLKLWDTFKVGIVPIIWGAPNVRSYLPHQKSAIFVEDFPDVEELANYLKCLAKNETAYLEYLK